MPIIRPSSEHDIAAITRIYGHHVLHNTGTFETTPPSENDMTTRRNDVLAKGLPWLVIEEGDQVLGFAYANWFKPRPAYRFSCEDSIYMAPESAGKGLGRALMDELLASLERAGVRQVMAVIGDSANAGSVGIHTAMGFKPAGVIHNCGWKFDRWLDIVLMEKTLGLGATTPPTDPTTASAA
ncbi:MAG: N-acetyltransferase family protein [Hydrogenophaga sp.]